MTDQPRDWDKELAAADRAIARSAAAPGAPTTPAGTPVVTPAGKARGGRLATLAVWTRVIVVLVIAAAMPLWPYGKACGLNLFLYLAVVGIVIVCGVWNAASTWSRRLGLAHILSIFVVLWGLVLAGEQVLPRIGYAREVLRWICP